MNQSGSSPLGARPSRPVTVAFAQHPAPDAFERLAAEFVGAAARAVPEPLASLVFASPICARSTDRSVLWHAGYRERKHWQLMLVLSVLLVRATAKFIVRILLDRHAYGLALYGQLADRLLLVSSVCGKESSDSQFVTAYVPTAATDAVAVFGRITDLGSRARRCEALGVTEPVRIAWQLLYAGLGAGRRLRDRRASRLLQLQWTVWVVGLDWYSLLMLERSLDRLLSGSAITKVACAHEMHAYARIVWHVAAKHGARRSTVQHAPVSAGKPWYFTYEPERAAGLPLPEVFYVFDDWTADRLRPSYPATRFVLGCSNRYQEWRTVTPVAAPRRHYLFVSGLARCDNTIVLNAVRTVIGRGERVPIRLRLHPSADLSMAQNRWLRRIRASGRLEISVDTSLLNDLTSARAVIGMGSSVLYEALLLSRPVIQVLDEDRAPALEISDLPGVTQCRWQELDAPTLKSCVSIAVDRRAAARRLGLDQPLVTYDRLFDPETVEPGWSAAGRA